MGPRCFGLVLSGRKKAAAAAVTASAREAASKLASKLEGPIETDGGAEKSGRAAGGKKADLAAAAKRQREEMRKAQSAHLRTMAGKVLQGIGFLVFQSVCLIQF